MNSTTQANEFQRFPSIGQFRNAVHNVKHKAAYLGKDANGDPLFDRTAVPPTIRYRGTVKLHGTNAAIVFGPGGITFQSRERILTQEEDNAGFYAYMSQHIEELAKLERFIRLAFDAAMTKPTITVYGEWCGGNIQKNVALSQLPKMFVIFAMKIGDQWHSIEGLSSIPNLRIYNSLDFDTWLLDIDFSKPEAIQNTLIGLTTAVEQQCPVAEHFGAIGIGEGIVWRPVNEADPEYWFKVKGEKHSASQVKTLAAVDVEAVQAVQDFVTKTVTENRLQQALGHLVHEQRKPFNQTSTGDFIRWVVTDIHKEEADTLAASGLTPKQVNAKISEAAKQWYFKAMSSLEVA